MVSPDVNTIFLPITVESIQEAHFARGYAGFVAAVGYLSMRRHILLGHMLVLLQLLAIYL